MTDRKNQSVATLDHAPFFERAFRYGVQQGLIDQARIEEITQDAANGTIQIAEYFGASSHLRPNLEDASKKMVSLVSLYLEDTTDGDLERSARLLREKPFRTLSRGGSSMLKSLYALPEDKHFGLPRLDSEKDFLYKTLQQGMSVQKYRQTFKAREQFSQDLRFAIHLSKKIGMPVSALSDMHASADGVIRTLLLLMAYGARKVGNSPKKFPDQRDACKIFASIRKEWGLLGEVNCSEAFMQEIPEEFVIGAQKTLLSIAHEDIPKIVNPTIPMDFLFERHLGYKYFFPMDPMAAVNAYDNLRAEKWMTLTNGAIDDESVLTLLLCVAAGLPARTKLSVAEAGDVVSSLRKHGVLEQEALLLIEDSPYADREHLSAVWHDFIEDARPYLLDVSDSKMKQVVNYLMDHCNIKKSKKKVKA